MQALRPLDTKLRLVSQLVHCCSHVLRQLGETGHGFNVPHLLRMCRLEKKIQKPSSQA